MNRSFRPCKHPGCPGITRDPSGYCAAHMVDHDEAERKYTQERNKINHAIYDYTWQKKIQPAYLRAHPLCEKCLREGRTRAATLVHHIKPTKEGGTHDTYNLEASCNPCHEEREGPNRWKRRQ